MQLAPAVRANVLNVLINELLQEELDQAEDEKREPSFAKLDETAYAELIGERHWIVHVFDFDELHVARACKAAWDYHFGGK